MIVSRLRGFSFGSRRSGLRPTRVSLVDFSLLGYNSIDRVPFLLQGCNFLLQSEDLIKIECFFSESIVLIIKLLVHMSLVRHIHYDSKEHIEVLVLYFSDLLVHLYYLIIAYLI